MKKKLLSLFVAIGVFASATVSVYAYTAYPVAGSRYRLDGGITNREYFISSSYLANPYEESFRDAMESWCTGSDALFTETTTYWDSCIDMKVVEDYYLNGVQGYTKYWVGDGAGGDNNTQYGSNSSVPGNWWCAETTLIIDEVPASNTSKVIEVEAHEIGHAFGFDENNSEPESIMCQIGAGRIATVPHTKDKYSLDRLYD